MRAISAEGEATMRRRVFIPVVMTFALAACGKADEAASDGTAKSAAANAAAAAAEFKLVAGQYRSTVTVQKFTAEGLPPQMAEMMGKPRSFEYCITAQQAAQGLEGLKQQMADGKCQYENFNAAGGKIDATFTCSPAPGMIMRASSKGTYSDSGSQALVVADMAMPGGKSIHVEQSVTAERIGDCAR
jgi:hypothetical protein